MSIPMVNAAIWLCWWAGWLLVGITARGNQARESFAERLPHLLLLLSAMANVFWSVVLPPVWPLGNTDAARYAALPVVVLGLLFSCWARWHLGRNWSGLVVIKEGHELVTSGPYRIVRHPIYTGLVVAMAATAFSINTAGAFVGLGLFAAAFSIKANHEELMLSRAFGHRYVQLCQSVRFRIIPFMF